MNYCLFVGEITNIGKIEYFKEKPMCEVSINVFKYVPKDGGQAVYDEITVKAWKENADHVVLNYSVGETVRVECKLNVYSGIGKESGKPYKISSLDLKHIFSIGNGIAG